MKKLTLVSALALIAGSVIAADTGSADQVKAAAKKLGANYSWKTTVENATGGRGFGGPSEGKTADGTTWISMSRRQSTVEAFLTGTNKGAIKTEDGWQSLAQAAQDAGGGGGFNPTSWTARTLQTYKVPAAQAVELAEQAKGLKKEGDAIVGELTEEGAKNLMAVRGMGGGQGPEIRNAKGTVKFWVKDGVLSKYEYNVKGSMTFNDNDREVDRTTTVEIKDVGATKVEVPAEAKAKVS